MSIIALILNIINIIRVIMSQGDIELPLVESTQAFLSESQLSMDARTFPQVLLGLQHLEVQSVQLAVDWMVCLSKLQQLIRLKREMLQYWSKRMQLPVGRVTVVTLSSQIMMERSKKRNSILIRDKGINQRGNALDFNNNCIYRYKHHLIQKIIDSILQEDIKVCNPLFSASLPQFLHLPSPSFLQRFHIINQQMHQQARKEAYRHLPSPLPIQGREAHPTSSLLSFIENQQDFPPPSKQHDELFPITERLPSKKNIHQIGDSLPALFSSPVYKCHEALDLTNNQNFCSWFTDQNYRISTTHTNLDSAVSLLSFQSRFQSGNLALAAPSDNSPRTYYLALQRDVNSTSGTTQWFYFKVNSKGNTGVFTFHIVNYVKPFSMFKVGMKPCVYSQATSESWERGGFDIEYRKNTVPYMESQTYYTLSFSYEFAMGENEVYFAYCFPYTYSRLQRFLNTIEARHTDKMRRKIITKTLGGNLVELVSITNPLIFNKRLLYITARVHPGETVSSFVCEAIIEFLLSNHPDAQKLRNQFIVKIVPMLNPDGVVNGSYRCSLSGVDLNRQWRNPNKITNPEIYNIKKIILESEYKKLLFIDIHGHSKKKASFMYGCVSSKYPYVGKELPYILSRRMSHFNYYTCNFATPRSKEGTSRITLWRAGIDHSYTYEVSFCGPQKEKRHFSILDLQNIGVQLCQVLCSYFYSRILQLDVDEELNRHCEEFYNDEQLLNAGNDETNGSSSELEDEMPQSDSPIKVKSTSFRRTGRSHNATEKTQSSRINDLLQQYMLKRSKPKLEQQQRQKQRLAQKDIYLKQRQSFMVTRVNLQQISAEQTYSNLSTYYGFAVDKGKMQPARSSSLRNSAQIALQSERRQKGQSFGILLPNVQKNQYKRYQRNDRKKQRNLGDRSISVYVQNMMQPAEPKISPSYVIKFNREISLGERIRSRISEKS